jgi:3-hydroxyisobutyrate dehydrogenase
MKIGIAGTGRMGAALAARLSSLGHQMMVWNRNADKARATGLKVADSPRALAEASEAVISILTDAKAVETVYREMLKGKVQDKLFIEMSTVRPQDSRKIASLVKEARALFVECPVGGTIGPAKEGKLFGFVGAEPADFQRATPILSQLCRRVEHLGRPGAGAAMKLAINLPLLVYYQALGEALSLCRGLDIAPARLIDIFADTSGGPNMLKVRGPAIAATLQGKETTPVTFDVDLIRKDLRTMLEEAAAHGLSLPLAARALDCYDAVAAEGRGASDATMLPAHWLRKGER